MVLADDKAVLVFLEDRVKAQPHTDQRWLAVDDAGGKLAHILTDTGKPLSLKLLLSKPFANKLLQQLNLEGETPLESIEATLEA